MRDFWGVSPASHPHGSIGASPIAYVHTLHTQKRRCIIRTPTYPVPLLLLLLLHPVTPPAAPEMEAAREARCDLEA